MSDFSHFDTPQTIQAARAQVLKTSTLDTVSALVMRAFHYIHYRRMKTLLGVSKSYVTKETLEKISRNPYVVADADLLRSFIARLSSLKPDEVAAVISRSPALARAVLLYHSLGKIFFQPTPAAVAARVILIDRAKTDHDFNVILQRFIQLNSDDAANLFVGCPDQTAADAPRPEWVTVRSLMFHCALVAVPLCLALLTLSSSLVLVAVGISLGTLIAIPIYRRQLYRRRENLGAKSTWIGRTSDKPMIMRVAHSFAAGAVIGAVWGSVFPLLGTGVGALVVGGVLAIVSIFSPAVSAAVRNKPTVHNSLSGESAWYTRLLAGSVAGLALSLGLHTTVALLLGFSVTALWPIAVGVSVAATLALAKPVLVAVYRWCVSQPVRMRKVVQQATLLADNFQDLARVRDAWAMISISVITLCLIATFVSFGCFLLGVFGGLVWATGGFFLAAVLSILGVTSCSLIPMALVNYSNFFAIGGSKINLPPKLWLRVVVARAISLFAKVVLPLVIAIVVGIMLFNGGLVMSAFVYPMLNSVVMSRFVGFFIPTMIALFAAIHCTIAWNHSKQSAHAKAGASKPLATAWESRLAMSTVMGMLVAGAVMVVIPGAPSILLLFGALFGAAISILPGFGAYFSDERQLRNPSLWNGFRGALTGLGLGTATGLVVSLIVVGTIFPGVGTLGATIVLMSAAFGTIAMMALGALVGDAIPGPLRNLSFLHNEVTNPASAAAQAEQRAGRQSMGLSTPSITVSGVNRARQGDVVQSSDNGFLPIPRPSPPRKKGPVTGGTYKGGNVNPTRGFNEPIAAKPC